MRALVFDNPSGGPPRLRLEPDRASPNPPQGEVRVRTILAGICNTDLEIVRGYAGFQGVLGHEFVGLVDQAEDPSLVGRRVVGEINASCGVCPTCRAGRYTHCPTRTTLGIRNRDGVLADSFCLPVSSLHVLPDNLPDEVAVFTEPLAAACQVLEQIQVQPTDRVIVLGDGKLGLLVAQVVALTGCDLVVVGRHPKKLAILAARGMATVLDGAGTQLEDAATQLDGGGIEGNADLVIEGNADLVIECTGQPEGFSRARQSLRPRGTLVLKSTYHGLVQTDLSSLVVNEIRVVGSRCGPFPPAIRLLSQGLVDVLPLIDAEYPLDEATAAFAHAQRRGALKVLVRP